MSKDNEFEKIEKLLSKEVVNIEEFLSSEKLIINN